MRKVTIWEKGKIVLATILVSTLFWVLDLLGYLHTLFPHDFEKKD